MSDDQMYQERDRASAIHIGSHARHPVAGTSLCLKMRAFNHDSPLYAPRNGLSAPALPKAESAVFTRVNHCRSSRASSISMHGAVWRRKTINRKKRSICSRFQVPDTRLVTLMDGVFTRINKR
jgi:hypothetical protein